MRNGELRLSEQAVVVLEMIAAGSRYEQILSAHPALTYLDIFDAAREALDLSVSEVAPGPREPTNHIAAIRTEHSRAYEPWTADEDAQLAKLFRDGLAVPQLSNLLMRQQGGIESRLRKLGLTT